MNEKPLFLIHELAHRLLAGNRIGPLRKKFKNEEEKKLATHKILYLILYDIWIELYGEDFARESVLAETNGNQLKIYSKA